MTTISKFIPFGTADTTNMVIQKNDEVTITGPGMETPGFIDDHADDPVINATVGGGKWTIEHGAGMVFAGSVEAGTDIALRNDSSLTINKGFAFHGTIEAGAHTQAVIGMTKTGGNAVDWTMDKNDLLTIMGDFGRTIATLQFAGNVHPEVKQDSTRYWIELDGDHKGVSAGATAVPELGAHPVYLPSV